jgi:hypothetical protein
MRDSYSGPAMALGTMRALGIKSLDVTCGCGRESIVDVSGWPGSLALCLFGGDVPEGRMEPLTIVVSFDGGERVALGSIACWIADLAA